MLGLSLLLAMQSVASEQIPPPRSSTLSECSMMVEVGKKYLQWGAKPSTIPLKANVEFNGRVIYSIVCPWSKLGVSDPILSSGNSWEENTFLPADLMDPKAPPGVLYIYSNKGPKVAEGQRPHPFFQINKCDFESDGHDLHLLKCVMAGIS